MLKDFLLNVFAKNQGKIIGAFIGLLFGILILVIGFFRTVVIVFFVFIGYYIGKKIDDKEDLVEFLSKILPSGWNK